MEQKHDPLMQTYRPANYQIHPLIYNRWSPRSMSGEELADEDLLPLFEAARMTPSSYNAQPWRFFYAKKNDPFWNTFFSLMVEFNQSWAKNAAALVVMASRKHFEHNEKPAATHSFDMGAAWMALSIEGQSRGLVVHGMQGFDYEKAKKALNIPDQYQVDAMAAIGKPAPKEALPKELQEKEKPSPRKKLSEILFHGPFSGSK